MFCELNVFGRRNVVSTRPVFPETHSRGSTGELEPQVTCISGRCPCPVQPAVSKTACQRSEALSRVGSHMALVASWWHDPEDPASHAEQPRPTAKTSLAHDPVSAAHGVVVAIAVTGVF